MVPWRGKLLDNERLGQLLLERCLSRSRALNHKDVTVSEHRNSRFGRMVKTKCAYSSHEAHGCQGFFTRNIDALRSIVRSVDGLVLNCAFFHHSIYVQHSTCVSAVLTVCDNPELSLTSCWQTGTNCRSGLVSQLSLMCSHSLSSLEQSTWCSTGVSQEACQMWSRWIAKLAASLLVTSRVLHRELCVGDPQSEAEPRIEVARRATRRDSEEAQGTQR